ncbi:MAG: hypothetical protein IH621_17000 [Krumholzibacteria bacterium]|nr:hypothetical protein [Candidatus Krumholzibacteria bacterium]
MNLEKLSSVFSRVFFLVSILLLALAVLEKLVNVSGYTIVRIYEPQRLLEIAATMMVFVIALLLRQIRESVRGGAH